MTARRKKRRCGRIGLVKYLSRREWTMEERRKKRKRIDARRRTWRERRQQENLFSDWSLTTAEAWSKIRNLLQAWYPFDFAVANIAPDSWRRRDCVRVRGVMHETIARLTMSGAGQPALGGCHRPDWTLRCCLTLLWSQCIFGFIFRDPKFLSKLCWPQLLMQRHVFRTETEWALHLPFNKLLFYFSSMTVDAKWSRRNGRWF